MAGLLLINPRSGDGRPSADDLRREAERRGVAVHVVGDGDDPARLAREAEAEVLGMAGGDGSLSAVAGVALERGLPFVPVPFGTRNHFARDLGLDRDDPLAALDAFGPDARERRVDVGRVGPRLFLNNVSLGVYARLVHRREDHRRRREALARLRAISTVATRREPIGITIDGEPVEAPVVLVANNSYSLEMLSIGERERLDEGLLHVYAPAGLLRRDWVERRGTSFTIDAAAGQLEAAVDGEPDVLETPLHFSVEPGALRARLPPG